MPAHPGIIVLLERGTYKKKKRKKTEKKRERKENEKEKKIRFPAPSWVE